MSMDSKVCRVCFSSEGLEPIFKNQNNQIALDLFLCTSVKIIELDQLNYAAFICSSCHNELNLFANFRNKAKKSEEIFQAHLKTSSAREIIQRNLFDISIKLESEPLIKSEPIECDVDLLQNIDTIIDSCTTVHETIFEDVNRQYHDDSDDQCFVRQKRKYKKRNRILDDIDDDIKCQQCPQKFSSRSNLNRHVLRSHQKIKSKRGRKPKHINYDDGIEEPSLYCELCKQFFTTRSSLQKHIKIKHDYVDTSDQYYCDFCGKHFLIKYYLIRHIKVRHHKVEVEKVKAKTIDSPIPCEVCGKILRNRGLLKPHMRSHQKMTADDYYYCDLCPRKFKTRGGCTWHIQQRHVLKAQFKCPQCPSIYRGKWELKCHIKSKHTNERDYRCEICGKGFLDKQKLTIHTRIHTGERPHVCHICPQTFIHQTDLRRHIWGHTGVRPYKCVKEGCGKGFMKKSELLTHENRCHSDSRPNALILPPPPPPPHQFQYQM